MTYPAANPASAAQPTSTGGTGHHHVPVHADDIELPPARAQMHARAQHLEAEELDLAERVRHGGVNDEATRDRIRVEAEDRADERGWRRGGPRLRPVRVEVRHGQRGARAPDAGPQLGEAATLEARGGREDRLGDTARLLAQAVTLQSERDERVVVRPHRPAVVRDRAVRRIVARERPDPPAAPHVVREQPRRDAPRALLRRYAAPEEVAGIRHHAPHGLLAAIETERVRALVLHPEPVLDARAQVRRERVQIGRVLLHHLLAQHRHAHEGVVPVALELDERVRSRGDVAVLVDERVVRVLPSHLQEPALAGAPEEFLEAVAVAVAVAPCPFEAALRDRHELANELAVPRPAPRLLEEDRIEERGVGRGVRGALRRDAEMRELPIAELVRHLPRLGLARRVDRAAVLELGEADERGARRPGMAVHEEVAAEERVAPEERREPGHAGGGEVRAGDGPEVQRRDVRARSLPRAHHGLIGAAQLRVRQQPVQMLRGRRRWIPRTSKMSSNAATNEIANVNRASPRAKLRISHRSTRSSSSISRTSSMTSVPAGSSVRYPPSRGFVKYDSERWKSVFVAHRSTGSDPLSVTW